MDGDWPGRMGLVQRWRGQWALEKPAPKQTRLLGHGRQGVEEAQLRTYPLVSQTLTEDSFVPSVSSPCQQVTLLS